MEMEFSVIDPNGPLSADVRDELERIHNEAFQPEERHFSVGFFIKNNRQKGFELWIAKMKDVTIGYAFFQIIKRSRIAVFWYMAVDNKWRNRGLGREIIRRILKDLKSRSIAIYYFILESRTPDNSESGSSFNRRRIAFYRSLGAYWIRNLDYTIASNTDPNASIRYELLFFAIGNEVESEGVNRALKDFAEIGYDNSDSRKAKFINSLEEMYIQPPLNE